MKWIYVFIVLLAIFVNVFRDKIGVAYIHNLNIGVLFFSIIAGGYAIFKMWKK